MMGEEGLNDSAVAVSLPVAGPHRSRYGLAFSCTEAGVP